jgi:CRP-like cAMP-binding protein
LATDKELPKVYHLHYKKGEQVFKQNDFGISIYKILRGDVEVFRECEGIEIPIAHLGAGSIIGEMIFFLKSTEIRSASARATEDSEIEVWHPMELLKEYEKASPVLKLIAKQEMDRLIRMNKFMDNLVIEKKMANTESSPKEAPWKDKRRFYRKETALPCTYELVASPKGVRKNAKGLIKNLSMTGLRLDVFSKNETLFPHNMGEVVSIEMVLPNGKGFKAQGRIVRIERNDYITRLGITFSDVPDGEREALGFFLLP